MDPYVGSQQHTIRYYREMRCRRNVPQFPAGNNRLCAICKFSCHLTGPRANGKQYRFALCRPIHLEAIERCADADRKLSLRPIIACKYAGNRRTVFRNWKRDSTARAHVRASLVNAWPGHGHVALINDNYEHDLVSERKREIYRSCRFFSPR